MPRSRLVAQEQQHGVGDAADAELQRGTVVHEVGDVAADGLFDRSDLGCGASSIRSSSHSTRRSMSETWMNAVAVGAGHLGVDLGDDGLRRLGRAGLV